jgi:aminoglycoside phosphotransferase
MRVDPRGASSHHSSVAEPGRAVTAIGEGLRAMHEALPIPECPLFWSAEERLAAPPRPNIGRADGPW